jgi:hypothetical protein
MLAHERGVLLKTVKFAAAPLSDAVVNDEGDEDLHHAAWFVKKGGTKLGRDRKRCVVLFHLSSLKLCGVRTCLHAAERAGEMAAVVSA